MKLFGSLLILCGGYGWWWIGRRERRMRLQTLEHLLAAVYRLREDIRMARLPMPQLLERLDGPFFAAVASHLRCCEDLAEGWTLAAGELPLSPGGRRVWCRLGEQLTGDEAGILRALDYTERELERERQELRQERREADRSTGVICFSTAAFLVILLL